jgi:hypothetical protein
MIAQSYQGNAWWIISGLFSLFMLSQFLWGAWQRYKVGIPVDVRAVAALCIFCLLFFTFAIFQVLTH